MLLVTFPLFQARVELAERYSVFVSVRIFYLKPLVLQDLLDGNQLSGVAEFSLVDNAERAITDDLSVRVAHLLWSVWALAWSGHDCCYLAAVFISLREREPKTCTCSEQK